MKKLGVRVLSLTIALLFLATSVGFSFLVIWQTRQESKQSSQTADIHKALKEAQQNNPGGDKLQGTKLSGFTPVSKIDKLQTIDQSAGSGQEAKASSTVTVHYTGAVASTGVIFQSSKDGGQPAEFALNQVIKGWTEGIPGMKVGGTRRLLIPAELAYGADPPQNSGIPANADLVFDVELIKVGN